MLKTPYFCNSTNLYSSRAEFELAVFLFHRNEMSGGDINTLFRGTMLDTHHDKLPFQNHKELYNIIDSTPLGDAQWQSFTIKYDRDVLDGKRPVWMDIEHEVWFHNPKQLLEMMLACPDFADEFDYKSMVQTTSITFKI